MSELMKTLGKWYEQLKDGRGWLPGRRPHLWRFLILLGGGILLLIYAGSFVNPRTIPPASPPSAPAAGDAVTGDGLTVTEKELEGRLERILSAVAGAGEVRVTVTLAAGAESVFAQNVNKQDRTVEEKDQSGGNRMTTESNEQGIVVFPQGMSEGKEEAVVIKTKRPEIAGVLVLAEGARNPELREEIAEAVRTVLDIPPHKVTVMPKESW